MTNNEFKEYKRNYKKRLNELKEELEYNCVGIGSDDLPFDIVKLWINDAILIAQEIDKLNSLHKKVLLRYFKDEVKRLFKMRRAQ